MHHPVCSTEYYWKDIWVWRVAWSSHLNNIYTEFILFKAYLPPQSSSIHPSAIFAKVAPLLPAACGPGCEFLLLVWAAKLLADLLPPRGRTLISWWRSLLGETCAGCRPVHPGPRFTTGPRAGPGRPVSTSLRFILGIQQHRAWPWQQHHNNNSWAGGQQQSERNRTGLTRLYALPGDAAGRPGQ